MGDSSPTWYSPEKNPDVTYTSINPEILAKAREWTTPGRVHIDVEEVGAMAKALLECVDEGVRLAMENTAMSMASRGKRVWEPARTEDSERITALYDMGWHCISGELLLEAMRRVEKGELADFVYAELWANADHEQVEGDEE